MQPGGEDLPGEGPNRRWRPWAYSAWFFPGLRWEEALPSLSGLGRWEEGLLECLAGGKAQPLVSAEKVEGDTTAAPYHGTQGGRHL